MKEENAPAQPADADLPPQVQADQYLLEAEKTLKNNDTQTAKTAFKKIEALNIEEPSPDFFFLYGKFLMENCNVANLAKAAENGQVQVLEALLAAGADVGTLLREAIAKGQVEVVRVLLAAGIDVNAKDDNGRTLLHVVSWNGQVEFVKSLIATGADVNAKISFGRTSLHFAA